MSESGAVRSYTRSSSDRTAASTSEGSLSNRRCVAQHAVAGELKRGVALSVALERRARPMGVMAVELHDQTLAGPHHVDLHARDEQVCGRARQAGLLAGI